MVSWLSGGAAPAEDCFCFQAEPGIAGGIGQQVGALKPCCRAKRRAPSPTSRTCRSFDDGAGDADDGDDAFDAGDAPAFVSGSVHDAGIQGDDAFGLGGSAGTDGRVGKIEFRDGDAGDDGVEQRTASLGVARAFSSDGLPNGQVETIRGRTVAFTDAEGVLEADEVAQPVRNGGGEGCGGGGGDLEECATRGVGTWKFLPSDLGFSGEKGALRLHKEKDDGGL